MSETTESKFYTKAAQYWSQVPATVNGMLGGFGHISQVDIRTSKMFLRQLLASKAPPGQKYALDCGAGIGRITKFLLTDMFDKVDLVEQNPDFLETAKKYFGAQLEHKIGEYYPVGLQDFDPEANKYDVIWIQWVLGHLTDKDFISFLKRCQKGLNKNGIIIVKENITSSDSNEIDETDSSVTRSMRSLKNLFTDSNLYCYRQLKQTNFPKGIYSVYMFALKPSDRKTETSSVISESDHNIDKLTDLVKNGLSNLTKSSENDVPVEEKCDNLNADTQEEKHQTSTSME